MRVHVSGDAAVDIVEPADCTSLSVTTAGVSEDAAAELLVGRGIATSAQPGAVWLDVDELRARAAPDGDADWLTRYDAMIEYARNAGWLDSSGRSVRAHFARDLSQ